LRDVARWDSEFVIAGLPSFVSLIQSLFAVGVAKIGVRNLIMQGVRSLNKHPDEEDAGMFTTLASLIQ
jgi:hypothetical protein